MKCIMDMHTHTLASGHAYSTLQENIESARERGLRFLGMSEHGLAMPGCPHEYYFGNYKSIPRQYGDLRLFCGMEADIMDLQGGLDVPEYLYPQMDYVIASMHTPCVTPGSRAENTRATILAMRNPYVKIIGHPDDSRYPLDYDELVRASKEEGVALEVNNSSLHPKAARLGGPENVTTLLETCMRYQVPVLLGTDSHICYSIGEFGAAISLMEKVGFPEELVLNTRAEAIGQLVNCALD